MPRWSEIEGREDYKSLQTEEERQKVRQWFHDKFMKPKFSSSALPEESQQKIINKVFGGKFSPTVVEKAKARAMDVLVKPQGQVAGMPASQLQQMMAPPATVGGVQPPPSGPQQVVPSPTGGITSIPALSPREQDLRAIGALQEFAGDNPLGQYLTQNLPFRGMTPEEERQWLTRQIATDRATAEGVVGQYLSAMRSVTRQWPQAWIEKPICGLFGAKNWYDLAQKKGLGPVASYLTQVVGDIGTNVIFWGIVTSIVNEHPSDYFVGKQNKQDFADFQKVAATGDYDKISAYLKDPYNSNFVGNMLNKVKADSPELFARLKADMIAMRGQAEVPVTPSAAATPVSSGQMQPPAVVPSGMEVAPTVAPQVIMPTVGYEKMPVPEQLDAQILAERAARKGQPIEGFFKRKPIVQKKPQELLKKPEKALEEKQLKSKLVSSEKKGKILNNQTDRKTEVTSKITPPDQPIVDNIEMIYKKYPKDPKILDKVPDEFKKDLDEATIAHAIRPVRHEFRRNYLANYEIYNPLSHASQQRDVFRISVLKEAKKIVKGMSPQELEGVTLWREGLVGKPTKLNPKQEAWDKWLDKKYDEFYGLFEVAKSGVGYVEKYSPRRLIEILEDEMFNQAWQGRKVPKDIQEWFKKRRTGFLDKTEKNSFKLFKKYIDTGSKALFLKGPVKHARENVLGNLPPKMQQLAEDYVFRILGYPAPNQFAFTATVKSVLKDIGLGKLSDKVTEENALNFSQFVIDLSYEATMGFRLSSPLRNLIQTVNNTVPELGFSWATYGVEQLLTKGFKEARDAGILIEFAPELYKELGELDKTKMEQLRNVSLCMFSTADKVNRCIAYYGAKQKFDFFLKGYQKRITKLFDQEKNIDKFMLRTEANKLHKFIRDDIRKALRAGDIDKAREIFAKEIVAKTQYLYNKEDAPIVTRHTGGKLIMQYATWPENYLELLRDWKQNKHWEAWLRWITVWVALSGVASRQSKKREKWLKRTVGVGPLRYGVGFNDVPVALKPVEDGIMLAMQPLFRTDPLLQKTKTRKAMKNWTKKFGNDFWNLYVPGGMAMKEYYEWLERR